VDDARWARFEAKQEAIARERERLRSTWCNPRVLDAERTVALFGAPVDKDGTLEEFLRRPEVSYHTLMEWAAPGTGLDDEEAADQVEVQIKYQGYIERQLTEIARQEQHADMVLPEELDYRSVRGLSAEVRQKLLAQRPETLAQAGRISGVTPAALSLLRVHVKRLGAGRGTAGPESSPEASDGDAAQAAG
jgi:tRNA uridine 5-carboxymethylaminomethyl modification enzyme